MSLRETKNTRLLDQMKRDPNFLENMKQQLRSVLDSELEKRGIPSVGGTADTKTFTLNVAEMSR